MEYRRIGNTDIELSAIAFGAWAIGGWMWGGAERKDAIEAIRTSFQMIQDRIILEAKRLLIYTDKSAKQITYDLGFEDSAYFSNFFKKHVSISPRLYQEKFAL